MSPFTPPDITSLETLTEILTRVEANTVEAKDHLKEMNGTVAEIKLKVQEHDLYIAGHKEGLDSLRSKLLYPILTALIIATIFFVFPFLHR